jgi:peptidoglycan/xylan/chitin deacetylase (PgdA/CDA1 family)
VITQILTTGAVGLLAGGAYYAAMSPTSQIYGRTLIAGCDPNEWALTFDDGPNDLHTGHLLEVLARHNVRATFFMLGRHVRQRPQIAREVVAAGHCIGNHTVNHPKLSYVSRSRAWSELAECNAILADTLGMQPEFFRPPWGARRPYVLELANALGLTPVMWNVTGCDWKSSSADSLLARIERSIARNKFYGRGSNILLHDGDYNALGIDRSNTVQATKLLLEKYAGESVFVTPEHWM